MLYAQRRPTLLPPSSTYPPRLGPTTPSFVPEPSTVSTTVTTPCPLTAGPTNHQTPSWSPRFRLRLSRSSARVNCHLHYAGNCKQGGGGDRGRAHQPRSDGVIRPWALGLTFFPPLLVLLAHPVTSGRCPVTWRRRASGAGPALRRAVAGDGHDARDGDHSGRDSID